MMLYVIGAYVLSVLLFPGTAGQLRARLVNGTYYGGRLEILYNGTWSTVCDDSFDNVDAQVACGMLGFYSPGAVAVLSNMYGAGQGSILLDDVNCRGTETSLEQCSHLGYYRHNCEHQEDIGVICNVPGQMTARLVNGTDRAGRLEILYNGTWSTVCDDVFDTADAQVACSMLGFNSPGAIVVSSAIYGAGEGTILLDDVNCKGTETSFTQCSHGGYYSHNCNHNEDVGVICTTPGEQLTARLVNGTQWAGRLEVLYNGVWSTVCDDNFEDVDAQVACRMLGFNSTGAMAVTFAGYGAGQGTILLDDVNCTGTETNLAQCSHNGYYTHNCQHSEDVGVVCIASAQPSARLVNGTQSSGRLEILYNGTWSTVCDDDFDSIDAQVACRMLGFDSPNALAVSPATFGEGQGTILLDDVKCTGTESSLTQCSHRGYYSHNCNHFEDVGIICNPPPAIQMSARLVNGTQWAGRLEVLYNGTWSTVCDDYFEDVDAQVACRMLGLNSLGAMAVTSAGYGAGRGTILLDDVNCRGTETNLAQCSHNGYYTHNCQHSEDVGVVCIASAQPSARLVNGTQSSGRLEILYNGTWSTVCDDDFDSIDAQVACRMLGFNSPNALAVSSATFGEGQGSILLDDVNCTGRESSLTQCSHRGYYSHNCNHFEDVGIICNPPPAIQMSARLVNGTQWAGRLEVLYNGTWSTVCDDYFEDVDAQVACRMLGLNSLGAMAVTSAGYGAGRGTILLDDVNCRGTETNLAQCSHNGYYTHNCQHSEDVGVVCIASAQPSARLVNGTQSSGRLEILYNGTWSTVCDDDFDSIDAQVACRMLGFNSPNALAVSSATFGEGQGSILLDDVNCTGRESSLTQCSHRGYYSHNCNHFEDVGIICNPPPAGQMSARLVNGTQWAGRLEILYNGTWSTVCDDYFGDVDAQVACMMLGFYSPGAMAVSSAAYGAGQGTILLDDVNCRGTETSLAQCFHNGYYTHNCQHSEDVGVVCIASSGGQLAARLVNGSQWAGRLEILYNGTWSTVCDDRFDNNDAQVVCRMLGLNSANAVAIGYAAYGEGQGSILLDEVNCNGTETRLEQCAHNGYYNHDCRHSEDVSVLCSAAPSGHLTARLVNGSLWAGRLEVLYNGTWNTVCDDDFGDVDAQVACKMLGFYGPGAMAVRPATYGAGQGSILLDDVNCTGRESNLAQCSHRGYYTHNCNHNEDVGIVCKRTIPQLAARLVNGTQRSGRLEILYNGVWSTVCDDGFDSNDALVACRMLGFNSVGATAVGYAAYGVGQGNILLDDVNCIGTETSLAQCSHAGYYNHNCNHFEDVGIICN